MRVRVLFTIVAIAAGTTGCQQYYEDRIDKLYARCDVPQMPPHALEECLDQTHKLAAAYSSPRLDSLLQKLEQSAEPAPDQPKRVGHNEEDVGQGADDNGLAGENADADAYGDEPPFQPDYDTVPPREPEQPPDPD